MLFIYKFEKFSSFFKSAADIPWWRNSDNNTP